MYKNQQKTLAIFTFKLKVYSLTQQGALWYIYSVKLYKGTSALFPQIYEKYYSDFSDENRKEETKI